jgi:2'-5' RNA ligase
MWSAEVDNVLVPIVADLYTASANKVLASISKAAPPDFVAPVVTNDVSEAYLRNATNRLKNIGNDLWTHASAGLADGMAAGEPIEQLSSRVQLAAHVTEPRADVIARTEVNTAANFGSFTYASMANDAGVGMTKEWLCVLDSRVRPDHRNANGQVQQMSDPFNVGGWSLAYPGDMNGPAGEVANCRCDIVYNMTDASGGTTEVGDSSTMGVIDDTDVTDVMSSMGGDMPDLTAALDVDDTSSDIDTDNVPDGDDDSDTDIEPIQKHTGAMVALVPSDADIARLALPGGETPEELHLTLFFLGDNAQYDDVARQQIVTNIQTVMLDQTSLSVTGFGVAIWNPLGDTPALVMNVGGTGLDEARDSVEDVLNELWQVSMPEQHQPWQPHVCLAYSTDPASMVNAALQCVGPITFDKVRVAFGAVVTDIPLGYNTVQMAIQAEATVPPTKTVFLATDAPSVTGTDTEGDSVGAIGQTNLPGTVPAMASWSTELATLPDGTLAAWEGILVVEGQTTGDGREFAPGSLTWADPWLPLRWAPEDFGEHQGAINVARIDEVWRDDVDPNIIRGKGFFNVSIPQGLQAYQSVQGQMLRGVSVDVDSVADSDVELIFPVAPDDGSDDGTESTPEDDMLSQLFGPPPDKMVFHAGRIRGATLVDLPAFVEAQISTVAMDAMPPVKTVPVPTSAPTASGTGDAEPTASVNDIVAELGRLLTDATLGISLARRRQRYDRLSYALKHKHGLTAQPFSEDVLGDAVKTLIACGNVDGYTAPNAWMFKHVTDQPVRLGVNIADDGRHIFGYAALWGTCHIGHPDVCTTAPREDMHAHYLLGEVLTSEGTRISVGTVTLGTGHAPMFGVNPRQAVEHYDNTGTAIADVVTGNDEHGIWFAGAIRHGVAPGRIAELRAAKLSGDWRRIGNDLRLVALLAVNVPGFGVPQLATRVSHGTQMALIAAGLYEVDVDAQERHTAVRRIKNRIASGIGRDLASKRAALRTQVHSKG